MNHRYSTQWTLDVLAIAIATLAAILCIAAIIALTVNSVYSLLVLMFLAACSWSGWRLASIQIRRSREKDVVRNRLRAH